MRFAGGADDSPPSFSLYSWSSIFLLLLMGIGALDGDISGQLFGKNGPTDAIHVSQEPFVPVFGWAFILITLVLAMQFARGMWKR